TQFGTAGGNEDGIVDVQAGNTIVASYDDARTGTGGPGTVSDNSSVSGGFDGAITLSPASIEPGDALFITVTDTDLDTNPGVAETVDVTVTDGTETETVTLDETGLNTGIFSNSLPSQLGAAGADQDGILDVQDGDTVSASYDDALRSNGGTATVSDNIAVLTPGNDFDNDGIGDATEALLTGAIGASQDALYFVDPDPSITVRDGITWATAFEDLEQLAAALGGTIPAGSTPTNMTYVAIADTRGYPATLGDPNRWKIPLASGTCSNIAFIGSIVDPQVDPDPATGIITELNAPNAQVLSANNCSNLQFHYVRFRDSGGPGVATGGAIRLTNGNVVFDTVRFDNNEATQGGGALHLGNAIGSSVVRYSEFENNDVDSAAGIGGGAVHLANNADLLVEDSRFIGNGAEVGSGGAIYAVQNADLSITRSLFAGNDATRRGGAVFMERNNVSGPSVIDHSTFSGNSADIEGGAAYYFCNVFTPPVRFFNNLVSGNGAPRGGAIAIDDCDAIQFDNNTFVLNQAENLSGGGAFHIDTVSLAAPNFRPMPEIYDNIFFANIDAGGVSAYSINNLSAWGAQESHENLMDDPASASTKDTVMVDHLLEFDVAWYLDQVTSSALNLSQANASNANKYGATPNRTTDRTGAADAAKADAGYHYETAYPGDAVSVTSASTLIGNNGLRGQDIRVTLLDGGGLPLTGGYRVAFEVDAVNPPLTIKQPSLAQDPLVPVAHYAGTDLGNGEYLFVVSTDGVPGPDTYTVHVWVDGIAVGTVVVPINP
ncbi:MAG: right-handed parallel beta-helix repeat-containing protein, partial [Gammaproteobacteria bacterium]|nr:right-handed parallel beta-helix repeat-containing protein [Gammaproteobacteria bacterium]NNF60220.1 right-handed parallel beta-helix repeat-containing protein [Gammaproteobacteria bacterium]